MSTLPQNTTNPGIQLGEMFKFMFKYCDLLNARLSTVESLLAISTDPTVTENPLHKYLKDQVAIRDDPERLAKLTAEVEKAKQEADEKLKQEILAGVELDKKRHDEWFDAREKQEEELSGRHDHSCSCPEEEILKECVEAHEAQQLEEADPDYKGPQCACKEEFEFFKAHKHEDTEYLHFMSLSRTEQVNYAKKLATAGAKRGAALRRAEWRDKSKDWTLKALEADHGIEDEIIQTYILDDPERAKRINFINLPRSDQLKIAKKATGLR